MQKCMEHGDLGIFVRTCPPPGLERPDPDTSYDSVRPDPAP